jgi:GTP-binding protein HflX
LFSVALVGYTNAGKSSLLNALTGERHAHTEDKLFATLDPLTRVVRLPEGRQLVLSDTVGFIRNLPHDLVAAFRATLEEVAESDLLLHVVDASHPAAEEQIAAVEAVLHELRADARPTLMVFNKADRLDDLDRIHALREPYEESYLVSALTGEGLDAVRDALSRRVRQSERDYVIRFAHSDGKWLSYLYKHGSVTDVEYGERDVTVRVLLDPRFIKPVTDYIVRA